MREKSEGSWAAAAPSLNPATLADPAGVIFVLDEISLQEAHGGVYHPDGGCIPGPFGPKWPPIPPTGETKAG